MKKIIPKEVFAMNPKKYVKEGDTVTEDRNFVYVDQPVKKTQKKEVKPEINEEDEGK